MGMEIPRVPPSLILNQITRSALPFLLRLPSRRWLPQVSWSLLPHSLLVSSLDHLPSLVFLLVSLLLVFKSPSLPLTLEELGITPRNRPRRKDKTSEKKSKKLDTTSKSLPPMELISHLSKLLRMRSRDSPGDVMMSRIEKMLP